MIRTIFLFLLFPIFAFAETPCSKRELPYRASRVNQIHAAVAAALYTGNAGRLSQLASCDFLIGPPESDAGGFRRAKRVMPDIARLMKGARFSSRGENYGTQVNFKGLAPKQNYELIYRKKGAGWYWAGMAVPDQNVLDTLLEGSYQIESEPELD